MTIREFYTLVGGSYDDMSERFPSDALILRFLTMLPQDGSMELLARSVDAADAKTAFRAVHTLKGVALNLGLTALALVGRHALLLYVLHQPLLYALTMLLRLIFIR